jgi:hypothetical protein
MNLANLNIQGNDFPLGKAWLLGCGNLKAHIVEFVISKLEL